MCVCVCVCRQTRQSLTYYVTPMTPDSKFWYVSSGSVCVLECGCVWMCVDVCVSEYLYWSHITCHCPTCVPAHLYWSHITCVCLHSCDVLTVVTSHVTIGVRRVCLHTCDVSHDAFMCVLVPIQVCDMTDTYVGYEGFICVTWRIHMCRMTDMTHPYGFKDSLLCATCRFHVCHTCSTRCIWVYKSSHVWRKSFIYISGLIHAGDMTHSCVSHLLNKLHVSLYTITRLTKIIHVCRRTHLYGWHDAFICVTPAARHAACESTTHYSSDRTHSYMSHNSFIWVTWRFQTCHACSTHCMWVY